MPPRDSVNTDLATALAAFHPTAFGFEPLGAGWLRRDPRLGEIVICEVSWEHAQAPSYHIVDGQRQPIDLLEYVVLLQQVVWGMPLELLVPSNILAISRDGGGSIIVAYQRELGFNQDGWLGFSIGLGSSNGTYVSHMLGVREDLRSGFDIGWLIKIVQGYIALQTNHSEMIWTFDPMRGANARLNIEKLAAGVDDLTLDKYGVLRSTLYGEVPSDRFTARWNLRSPVVHERIQAVHAGRYTPATFQDMADAVELFGRDDDPAPGDRVRYEIPGDIDALMERDPTSAIRWRQQMRRVLTSLVSTKNRVVGDYERDGPAAIGYEKQYGTHQISAFATELAEGGERRSAYLLTRIKKGE